MSQRFKKSMMTNYMEDEEAAAGLLAPSSVTSTAAVALPVGSSDDHIYDIAQTITTTTTRLGQMNIFNRSKKITFLPYLITISKKSKITTRDELYLACSCYGFTLCCLVFCSKTLHSQ
jgi:hypothetical protein